MQAELVPEMQWGSTRGASGTTLILFSKAGQSNPAARRQEAGTRRQEAGLPFQELTSALNEPSQLITECP